MAEMVNIYHLVAVVQLEVVELEEDIIVQVEE